jgi:hypothetical protein
MSAAQRMYPIVKSLWNRVKVLMKILHGFFMVFILAFEPETGA